MVRLIYHLLLLSLLDSSSWNPSIFPPLISATGTAVEGGHGLVGRSDLKLIEVGSAVFTLITSNRCRVCVFPHFFST